MYVFCWVDIVTRLTPLGWLVPGDRVVVQQQPAGAPCQRASNEFTVSRDNTGQIANSTCQGREKLQAEAPRSSLLNLRHPRCCSAAGGSTLSFSETASPCFYLRFQQQVSIWICKKDHAGGYRDLESGQYARCCLHGGMHLAVATQCETNMGLNPRSFFKIGSCPFCYGDAGWNTCHPSFPESLL